MKRVRQPCVSMYRADAWTWLVTLACGHVLRVQREQQPPFGQFRCRTCEEAVK